MASPSKSLFVGKFKDDGQMTRFKETLESSMQNLEDFFNAKENNFNYKGNRTNKSAGKMVRSCYCV